jgi:hypothetical protein
MMAQPRSEKVSVPVHTLVAPATRAALAELAERNERSVAAEMRVALREHVNAQPAEKET